MANTTFPTIRLTCADLKELVARFKRLIRERTGKSFPRIREEQLSGAIGAVFGSWMNDRAIVYRRKYGIPPEWGTAVNVQTMVFGNMGDTAHPASLSRVIRPPEKRFSTANTSSTRRAKMSSRACAHRIRSPIWPKKCPQRTASGCKVRSILERHFKDMQDLEFTVEENRLYILQTRNGKRTGLAAVRIAVRHGRRKIDHQKDAVRRVPADHSSICSRQSLTASDAEAQR